MLVWLEGEFCAFEGYEHMQFQIEGPTGLASVLKTVIDTGRLHKLPFLRG